ncbi:hypothetical protein Cni_G16193 [Canna indica]|uniref:Uncharacterized protein n=1 Tax=Canna indica TaxID=4628 RepID=A0AAQ3KEZ5_9LILI|nr:hypothetical protein Cni_G16193 [Canna indica]
MQIQPAYELMEQVKNDYGVKEAELELKLNHAKVELIELKVNLLENEAEHRMTSGNKEMKTNNQEVQKAQMQSELELNLIKSINDIEDLKTSLMNKEIELQNVLEENRTLKSEREKREHESCKGYEAIVAELNLAKATEQNALVRLRHVAEEADKNSKRAIRVAEQLSAAQAINSEMEYEMKRLRIQCDQWRKATELATGAIDEGGVAGLGPGGGGNADGDDVVEEQGNAVAEASDSDNADDGDAVGDEERDWDVGDKGEGADGGAHGGTLDDEEGGQLGEDHKRIKAILLFVIVGGRLPPVLASYVSELFSLKRKLKIYGCSSSDFAFVIPEKHSDLVRYVSLQLLDIRILSDHNKHHVIEFDSSSTTAEPVVDASQEGGLVDAPCAIYPHSADYIICKVSESYLQVNILSNNGIWYRELPGWARRHPLGDNGGVSSLRRSEPFTRILVYISTSSWRQNIKHLLGVLSSSRSYYTNHIVGISSSYIDDISFSQKLIHCADLLLGGPLVGLGHAPATLGARTAEAFALLLILLCLLLATLALEDTRIIL